MRIRIPLLSIAAGGLLLSACGGGDGSATAEGNGQVRDSHGVRIITANDAETGLQLELQDDNLYLELTGDTPAKVRDRIKGQGLAGECEGAPGKDVPGLARGFQIFWRERSGDWGSAVLRLPKRKPPLSDVVKTCRIYAAAPGSSQIEVGGSNRPVAEIDLR
jgi:hypothetical protein